MKNKQIGRIGEEIASKYIISKGYKILSRNFTLWGGELDIIAAKLDSIIFIEVKTRLSENSLDNYFPVDDIKIHTIVRTAEMWLMKNNYPEIYWQIDLICILLEKDYNLRQLEHIENITN